MHYYNTGITKKRRTLVDGYEDTENFTLFNLIGSFYIEDFSVQNRTKKSLSSLSAGNDCHGPLKIDLRRWIYHPVAMLQLTILHLE